MSIVALDPGGTTGIAIRLNDGSLQTLVAHRRKDIFDIIYKHIPPVCVFEDFLTPGNISKDGLHAVRLIGAIEAYCFTLDIATCVQHPAERKQFIHVARDILKSSPKKTLVHELDALSHLLVYEHRLKNGLLPGIMKTRRTNEINYDWS